MKVYCVPQLEELFGTQDDLPGALSEDEVVDLPLASGEVTACELLNHLFLMGKSTNFLYITMGNRHF